MNQSQFEQSPLKISSLDLLMLPNQTRAINKKAPIMSQD